MKRLLVLVLVAMALLGCIQPEEKKGGSREPMQGNKSFDSQNETGSNQASPDLNNNLVSQQEKPAVVEDVTEDLTSVVDDIADISMDLG